MAVGFVLKKEKGKEMAHSHNIIDTDTHFSINPVTRAIKNESSRKTTLIQYDHNSERFTFTLPRYIEGHDMSLCNNVRVHYINVDSENKRQVKGVYEVEDLHIDSEDENKVLCSWLISSNATQYAGGLSFLIRYACIEKDTITYAWNTAVFSEIYVGSGLDSAVGFESQYFDIIQQWKDEVMKTFNDHLAQWKADAKSAVLADVTEWKKEASANVDEKFNKHSTEWNQKLAVERARIDQFKALKEGSTTGDAELMDMRIDSDGKIHDSAGAALRSQINENRYLTESLVLSPEFAFGYRWIDEQGQVHEDANYATTKIMDLTDCKAIKFRLYQYNDDSTGRHLSMIAYYDENLTHIESITEIAESNGIVEATVIPPDEAKYAIVGLYKPIGNGYVNFYYDVNKLANINESTKAFDLCKFPTSSGYIRTDGVVIADENWVCTDYIPVKAGKTLELSMHGHQAVNSVSYYDINKVLIGAVVADIEYIIGTTEKFKFGVETIPGKTVFIRLCFRIGASTTSSCKYLVNTNEVMHQFQQYGTDIKHLYSSFSAIAQTTEKFLAGKIIFLAGDSRSSTDYSFYGETMEEKTGAAVIVGGASGWKTSAIASDSYFTRLTNNAHDFSIWLVGGNDTGESGTVGTFDNTSTNGLCGEKVVEETDISIDYSGSTFVQAVDHIMRKYKKLFYDWKALDNGHKPKMIFCTDIPQKRSGGDATWSLPDNWERKRQAVIECCKKNNVACLDLCALCNFDMEYEPEWTSPTDKVNNNGLYFMDGLHPNKYGIDVITSLEIEEIKKHLTIY